MLDKLLATATNNAKLALAAIAGAALVAGGSAVAFQQVSDDTSATPNVTVSQQDTAAGQGAEHRSDTATAHINLPKPSKSPKPTKSPSADGAQGVHGACVSAVAQDKSTVGRDHGKAVSEAAHSCPKGGDDATETDANTSADANENENDGSDDANEVETPKSASEHGKSASHRRNKD